MSPVPSYYDSIGLLVICDAIDSVDGIPFYPDANQKPLPSFRESITLSEEPPSAEKISSSLGKSAPIQHTLLAHIPVTGVFSPFGTIPYEEQQRMAINQLATTGQLPQQPPAHTIGGVRPNVPVAHNLNGSGSQRSRSLSVSQSSSSGRIGSPYVPGTHHHGPSPLGTNHVQRAAAQQSMGARSQRSESPAVSQQPTPSVHSPVPAPQSVASPGISNAISNPGAGSGLNSPGFNQQGVSIPGSNAAAAAAPTGLNHTGFGTAGAITGGTATGGATTGGTTTGNISTSTPPVLSVPTTALNSPSLNTATSYMGIPPLSSDISAASGVPGIPPLMGESRASTPGSPDSSQSQYRVEVCQICGRDFKGRKAATHKQQHIRRLHPAEYTPKRGGKKSRTD